jgi:hypothetical protein
MKTKPFILKLIFLGCAMFIFMPSHAYEVGKEQTTNTPIRTKQEFKAAYEDLLKRGDALIIAKKNATTQAEKQQIKEDIKAVKKETKALKEQAVSGGIYIGGGALLILVLLLLLL